VEVRGKSGIRIVAPQRDGALASGRRTRRKHGFGTLPPASTTRVLGQRLVEVGGLELGFLFVVSGGSLGRARLGGCGVATASEES
jgi:hypothetical protein